MSSKGTKNVEITFLYNSISFQPILHRANVQLDSVFWGLCPSKW